MRTYFYEYLDGGLEKLAKFNIYKPQRDKMELETIIREEFPNHPPATRSGGKKRKHHGKKTWSYSS